MTSTKQAGILLLLLLGGCAMSEKASPSSPMGASITQVQTWYGLPDVISDRSGDLERYYSPTNRPAHEWPAEATRTFYYLDRGVVITFVHGQAVEVGPLSDEDRQLMRSVRPAQQ